MTTPSIVDATNLKTMQDADVVRIYSMWSDLEAAERSAFDALGDAIKGVPILDIGVGGGRTVGPLSRISTDYVGIDNSPAMIAACKRRFPDRRFELADARTLENFGDGAFQLVVFSCNGIGMVAHQDRLAILRQVHRVLAKGGHFVFSNHNQRSERHDAGFVFPDFERTLNPAAFAVRAARFLRQTLRRARNRNRLRPSDLRGPDYSIINDACHDYGTMLYYISPAKQAEQLASVGFSGVLHRFGLDGRSVGEDARDDSVLYVARK
ncbi:MAG: class I SAM-dependent methyltransferase [Polyangiaceae bacterium]